MLITNYEYNKRHKNNFQDKNMVYSSKNTAKIDMLEIVVS